MRIPEIEQKWLDTFSKISYYCQDEDTWFNTDVIVSAAPELFDDYDEEQYRKVMTQRIMMFLSRDSQNRDIIILL